MNFVMTLIAASCGYFISAYIMRWMERRAINRMLDDVIPLYEENNAMEPPNG